MEPIESSETSAYNSTLTPGTYPKEKKLQSKHGESLKSRTLHNLTLSKGANEILPQFYGGPPAPPAGAPIWIKFNVVHVRAEVENTH